MIMLHDALLQTEYPPIVSQCIDFLSLPECLATEGIFRRAARVAKEKEYQSVINAGGKVEFSSGEDVHLVRQAAIMGRVSGGRQKTDAL